MPYGVTPYTLRLAYASGRYCRRSVSVRQMYLSSLALMIISFSCRASQPNAWLAMPILLLMCLWNCIRTG